MLLVVTLDCSGGGSKPNETLIDDISEVYGDDLFLQDILRQFSSILETRSEGANIQIKKINNDEQKTFHSVPFIVSGIDLVNFFFLSE